LFFSRVAFAGIETNTYQLTDTQSVLLLERAGRYDEAEAHCVQMLQKNPNDPDVKRLLEEIEDAKHKPHSSTTLREALEEIIIPEVNFRGARTADVIDFLRVESQKVSGTDNPINFVWEAPESFKTAKVTLNLRSVPLADVLKYVTDSAGLRYRVDPHAVVIYQPPPVVPTESSSSNDKSP
jgi:hypothetical protein